MKVTFNITTSEDDIDRFETSADLDRLMEGFDGVELMYFGDDPKGLITPERVVGLHMDFYYNFTDFWNGNIEAALENFVTPEDMHRYYGGETRDAIVDRFKGNLEVARRFGAEYLVFHVSDATIEESFTRRYHLTDEEVVDAACEVLNEVFADEGEDFLLLLENLWQPGLSFMRPEMAWRLLEGIDHKNTGFMLDTGHLLHTNLEIYNQAQGLEYIHGVLDNLGDELVGKIRGMHLNQSVTSEYSKLVMDNPPAMAPTYAGRNWQMFGHVYKVDQHLPFTAPGVDKLVERVAPDYLTFEFITDNNATHTAYLNAQRKALGML